MSEQIWSTGLMVSTMNEEIYQLQDALNKFWQWEDKLQETDRDAWKDFQALTDELQEAVAEAEEQLGWAVAEAREYALRCENLEDELDAANTLIQDMRESREDMVEAMQKWMEEF